MSGKEKDTKGVTAEKDEFSEWFTQIMLKADLADYTEVSGCMVFKPRSYAIWEKVKECMDERFKKFGIKNCYFPLFIPEKYLMKEKEHVKGFSPEVAWVTEAGDTKLNEKLAVRPTSETIMYPSYAKWIKSWRELPLRLNQWNNVIRWEFKHPVPFFRTREFLWNELHTALASEEEAMKEGFEILESYKDFCEKEIALYGMIGKKTDKEKFAGGVASYKLHYILPSGRVIEGPCFHYDGQNFAKAYNIKFLDKEGKGRYVYQNTYAISTRMLGTMFAIHSDEKGLIMPPRIASEKVVVVPIIFEKGKEKIIGKAKEICRKLKEHGAFVDEREDYSPGWKFNEWELKGIPIRIEIGPKDIEKKQVVLVRRDNGKKEIVKEKDVNERVVKLLGQIQEDMLQKSKKLFESKIEKVISLDKLKKIIEQKKVGIIPLCTNAECEDMIKFETKGAKALFISDDKIKASEKCIICGKKANYYVYAGKSY